MYYPLLLFFALQQLYECWVRVICISIPKLIIDGLLQIVDDQIHYATYFLFQNIKANEII